MIGKYTNVSTKNQWSVFIFNNTPLIESKIQTKEEFLKEKMKYPDKMTFSTSLYYLKRKTS